MPTTPASSPKPVPLSDPAPPLAVTEVLDAGALSQPELIRGRALGVARGTITDEQLAEWFVEERAQTERTRQSYVTQLRRLIWFTRQRMNLPSVRHLQREDWQALREYLAAPPAHDIMAHSVAANDADWRPFRGPLSASSQAVALTVITQFMDWLASAAIGAMPRSPFGGLKPPRQRVTRTGAVVERYINDAAFGWLTKAIAGAPEADLAQEQEQGPGKDLAGRATQVYARRYQLRRRWILTLGLMTGLRASELAAARSSMIRPDPRGGWVLEIVRKGGARSRLPLSQQLVAAWHQYRSDQGIPRDADVPLIGRVDSLTPSKAAADHLTRQAIWGIVKQTCSRAAALAEAAGDVHSADSLLACSTHWVRHTFAVQMLDSGSDMRSVQDLLEHASIATTSMYLHVDAGRRRSDLEVMAGHVAGRLGLESPSGAAGADTSPSPTLNKG